MTTVVDKKNLQDNPYWRDCSDEELTFQIEGLATSDGLRLDRMNRRVSLLAQFEDQRRMMDRASRARDFDSFHQRALALVTSEATRRALDIHQEPSLSRDRYGRNLFGQSALIARRLVEAGVRFVTLHYDACDGYGWDSHVHTDDVKNHLMPTFDQALSALLIDLDERGLLAETLVVALGEMDRTPLATPRWGRGTGAPFSPKSLQVPGSAAERPTDPPTKTPLTRSIIPSAPRAWLPRSMRPSASPPTFDCPIRRADRSRSSRTASRSSSSWDNSVAG